MQQLHCKHPETDGHALTYRITEIPDPSFTRFEIAAGGKVRPAIAAGAQNLLQMIRCLPAGRASFEILWVYGPEGEGGHSQDRLRIYLRAWSADKALAKVLASLLERGALSFFYPLQPVDSIPAVSAKLDASCDILRQEDFITPLYGPDQNPSIPEFYYAIRPFVANEDNDGFVTLDRVLSNQNETIAITMRVQSADVSAEQDAYARYMNNLESINRGRGPDGDEEGIDEGRESDWKPDRPILIEPLRCRDSLAGQILRNRFHESLYLPHLMFHLRVLAHSPQVAQLIGSVLAELAFQEGSYRLVVCGSGEPMFDEAAAWAHTMTVAPVSVHLYLWKGQQTKCYYPFARLSHLATVDELLGAFHPPVASFGSPCCIRKNTDPPLKDKSELIVVGYEHDQPTGAEPQLRGIALNQLTSHVSIFGMPGSGKTISCMNMLVQLWSYRNP